MIRLTSSQDTAYMARLRHFMLRNGVAVTVSERAGKLDMWLLQEHQQPLAQALLSEYIDDPAAMPDAAPSGGLLKPTLRTLTSQAGLVTFMVALAVLAVAAAQFFWSMQATLGALIITPPGSSELDFSQPWRLFTPALLHMSATHLIFNIFWWWYLGGRIELTLGGKTLVLLLLVCGISANLLQWYTTGPLFGGLSGVVYGLFGFCAVYGWRRQSALSLPPALLVFMIGWLLLGYTEVLWVNMANDAHLMGLISGALIGLGYRFQRTGFN
ncbi:rhomboid family intramembrane serine protease [Aliidiomarina maris]|nr:rhomboid family intramembrane serine protease [Aliidiomarina maris]